MGYYNNTPISVLFRRRELSPSRIRLCYDDYREAMATMVKSIPALDVWWDGGGVQDSGCGTSWPTRPLRPL